MNTMPITMAASPRSSCTNWSNESYSRSVLPKPTTTRLRFLPPVGVLDADAVAVDRDRRARRRCLAAASLAPARPPWRAWRRPSRAVAASLAALAGGRVLGGLAGVGLGDHQAVAGRAPACVSPAWTAGA